MECNSDDTTIAWSQKYTYYINLGAKWLLDSEEIDVNKTQRHIVLITSLVPW